MAHFTGEYMRHSTSMNFGNTCRFHCNCLLIIFCFIVNILMLYKHIWDDFFKIKMYPWNQIFGRNARCFYQSVLRLDDNRHCWQLHALTCIVFLHLSISWFVCIYKLPRCPCSIKTFVTDILQKHRLLSCIMAGTAIAETNAVSMNSTAIAETNAVSMNSTLILYIGTDSH